MNPLGRLRERRRADRELAAEMAAHLEERVEDWMEKGYTEEEARSLARRQFGNALQLHEESVERWGWTRAAQLAQDLQYGFRVLRAAPAYTMAAVLVLALGIGMNAAMYSVIKAILLTSLPYPEPGRLVALWQTSKARSRIAVSGPDFADWRAMCHSFETLAKFESYAATLSGSFEAKRVRMAPVGGGFFEVIGTPALGGRVFGPGEQKLGAAPTMILSYELAQSIYGDALRASGQRTRLNGLAFTVIGVMPPKFNFPDRAQIWIPNDAFPDLSNRSAHNYRVIGRLKQNVSLREAQADLDVVATRLAKAYADDKDLGIRAVSLYDELVGSIRPSLVILFGAVTLVLLIACVNTAGLQLARAWTRKKELGLRVALGAGRGRLVRQLLTESILLSALGGVAGLALAAAAVVVLRSAVPANVPRLTDFGIDWKILCFTGTISILAGLLCGIVPALKLSGVDANEGLKEGAGKGLSKRQLRSGQLLAAAQIALTVVLLSGASLLLKSYWKLSHVPTGMQAQGVLVTSLTWPASPDGNSVDRSFVEKVAAQIISQIEYLPGVTAAAFVHSLPFQSAPNGSFEIFGRALPLDPHQAPDANYRLVTRNFFRIYGIPFVEGRPFTPADERSQEPVAIVNQAFERAFFPAADAIGHRIRFFGFDRKPRFLTIIGSVPDFRAAGVKAPVRPEVFADYFQHADSVMDADLVVRGPATAEPAMRRIVTALNPDTAVNFEAMDAVIAGTLARERFETGVLVVFAGCALLLAMAGIYGLLSYIVAARTGEFGVRMAVGAASRSIEGLVLRQGVLLIGAGAAAGLMAAALTTGILRSLLYGVGTTDPTALLAGAGALVVAGIAACYAPARRAMQIDPAITLRQQT